MHTLEINDFSNRNLKGCSFKNRDLSRANFSGAKIQGVNFSGATLVNAKFVGAEFGVEAHWMRVSFTISSLFSVLTGFMAARVSAWLLGFEDRSFLINPALSHLSGIFIVAIWLIFLILARYKSLTLAIGLLISLLASSGIFLGLISVISNSHELAYVVENAYRDALLVIALSSIVITVFFTHFLMSDGKMLLVFPGIAILGVASVIALTDGPISTTLRTKGILGLLVPSIIAVFAILEFMHINKRILHLEQNNEPVRSVGISICAFLGTNFKEADLRGADFSYSKLRNSDFRTLKLDRTTWYQAKGLEYIRWGNSVLADSRVRSLLVTRSGKERSYTWANLQGVNLKGIDFENADFEGARLIDTDLSNANLRNANLKFVKALGANFSSSILTGSCIEGWVINHATRFKDVQCDFVYHLKEPLQETDDRKRNPRIGKFGEGCFEELFQVVLDTIEIVLRGDLDRKILVSTLYKISKDFGDIRLRSIDQRTNGMIVLHLSVPDIERHDAVYLKFQKVYQDALKELKSQQDQYRKDLEATHEQLLKYQKTSVELIGIAGTLKDELAKRSQKASQSSVNLVFWDGNLEEGYHVTAELCIKGLSTPEKLRISPTSSPELLSSCRSWKRIYHGTCGLPSRITFPKNEEITNISYLELQGEIESINSHLNQWLKSESFRTISDKLREEFSVDDEINILIQTDDSELHRLPWHLWEFFRTYRNAGFAFGLASSRISKSVALRSERRVLAVFGNYHDVDVQGDQKILEGTLGLDAFIKPILKPSRQSFHDALWSSQGWDILLFSGHSFSQAEGDCGSILLNPREHLDLDELRSAIMIAVENGLRIIIFNSCDGLGIVKSLAGLSIPYMIAMQEVVPDRVAQIFLERLAKGLINGKSIYIAVRQAKEYLEGLEDRYPCASWLPVLFHNPAEPIFYWRE